MTDTRTKRPSTIFALALLALGPLLGGCSGGAHESETQLPWGGPAHWEGNPSLIEQPGRRGY